MVAQDDTLLRRYTRRLTALIITGLALVATFNALVDPYDMFNGVTRDGFNTHKIAVASQERLTLAHRLRHQQPDTVIFGASRSMVGINPDHPGWGGARVYNASLGGATPEEMLAYLKHAIHTGQVKHVLLGLDFILFNAHRDTTPLFNASRLMLQPRADYGPWPYMPYRPKDVAQALISFGATADSVKTLRRRAGFYADDSPILANGFMDTNSWSTRITQREGGQRQYFLNTEKTYLNKIWFPKPSGRYCFADEESGRDNFAFTREFLRVAREHNLQVTLFINPTHARQKIYYRYAGLENAYALWLRKLVAMVEEVSATSGSADTPPLTLWDFTLPTALTMEEVPPAGDTETLMQWHWEFSHYRPELGDRVLDKVFGHSMPGNPVPEDFGIQLSSTMLEQYVTRITHAARMYEAAHAQDAAEIQQIVKDRLGEGNARVCEALQ